MLIFFKVKMNVSLVENEVVHLRTLLINEWKKAHIISPLGYMMNSDKKMEVHCTCAHEDIRKPAWSISLHIYKRC